ncbi:MAG: WYL domain-containing protein, partial [Cellulomonas sp.]|nr:WYL domain-containing protein [Cellulomonas sp.]
AAVLASWSAGESRVATLAVRPERAEALRARSVDATEQLDLTDAWLARVAADRDVVHVPFTSAWELAEEVVGYGDAVVVLAPQAVRETVLRLLRVAATLDAAGDTHG